MSKTIAEEGSQLERYQNLTSRLLAWRGARCRATSAVVTHYFGWSGKARRPNIRFLAYKTRFLIHWHSIYFLEPFVDPERFRSLEGDKMKAKTAYQEFLTLWKDADPDIPILKQAKAEYATP